MQSLYRCTMLLNWIFMDEYTKSVTVCKLPQISFNVVLARVSFETALTCSGSPALFERLSSSSGIVSATMEMAHTFTRIGLVALEKIS